MSEYFTNFPLINYDINKTKPSNTVKAVDIFRRNTIREKVLNNLLTYYPYYIQPGERPDTLSHQYYGSIDYMWIILFANDIMDVYYEWPLFGTDLKEFIIKKYGSVVSSTTLKGMTFILLLLNPIYNNITKNLISLYKLYNFYINHELFIHRTSFPFPFPFQYKIQSLPVKKS